jgi:hypothetical protein
MKHYIFFGIFVFVSIVGMAESPAAKTYLAQKDRGLAVAGDMLPKEIENVDIKDFFIPNPGDSIGELKSVRGHLVVVHKDSKRSYFATAGDKLYMDDDLFTLGNSGCRIKFDTGDLIVMGESARLCIDHLVDDRKMKKKESVIHMIRGKAMFYIVRLFRYRLISATVTTENVSIGVRGTVFGVDMASTQNDQTSLKMPVLIADRNTKFRHWAMGTGELHTGLPRTTVIAFRGSISAFNFHTKETVTLSGGKSGDFTSEETRVYDSPEDQIASFLQALGLKEIGGSMPGTRVGPKTKLRDHALEKEGDSQEPIIKALDLEKSEDMVKEEDHHHHQHPTGP